jgi:hypothetical protein
MTRNPTGEPFDSMKLLHRIFHDRPRCNFVCDLNEVEDRTVERRLAFVAGDDDCTIANETGKSSGTGARLLAFQDDPSFFAGRRASAVALPDGCALVERAVACGPLADRMVNSP